MERGKLTAIKGELLVGRIYQLKRSREETKMRAIRNRKSAVMICVLFMIIMVMAAPVHAASSGGWSVSGANYSFLTSGQQKIFNKAVKGLTGVSYKPVALLAKQTVQGTNYVFLAQGTTATAKPVKAWYVLTATKTLKKKIKLLSIKKIKLSGIKTGTNPRTDTLEGGLEINAIKNKPAALKKSVRTIFKKGIAKYTGYELRPITLLGTQTVAGKNYRFLCCGIGYTGKDLFVVDIYKNLKGKCSLTSCKPFNLEKYVG